MNDCQRAIGALLLTAAMQGVALAAEDHSTDRQVMLVLDASGSMWGRVESREKITIAREVIGDLLADWDERLSLGLIAYGHRRKGDCNDIETLIPAGPVDADQVRRTIAELIPKGKTPLSAAVRQAAEALRYTENKATVILVSDGKETCNVDPCSLGAELEQLGVDFTAHVIGFDIAAEERAGLECLATATGGRYFDAQRTEQLQSALDTAVAQVQQAPPPVAAPPVAAAPTSASLTAADAAPIGSALEVSWQGPDGERDYISVAAPDMPDNKYTSYSYTGKGSPVNITLPDVPGVYELRYIDAQSKTALARRPIEVTDVATSISAADQAALGSSIEISWVGPNNARDYITVVAPDTADNKHGKYIYTQKGSPGRLAMPDQPGVYELRYVSSQSKRVLARQVIEVTDVTVEITAADSAAAGSAVEITWIGPNNARDYITVVTPDTPDNKHGKYIYTQKGGPDSLAMPDQPGVYELRYVSAQSKRVLARRPISVSAVSASLNALVINAADQPLRLWWQGPANPRDILTIAQPDMPDNKYLSYKYAREGSPLELKTPDAPGLYELRYVTGQSKQVLIRQPVEIISADQLEQRYRSEPAGRVTLQALDAQNQQLITEGLSWTLYGVLGVDKSIHRSSEAQPQFELPTGVYRATVNQQGGASVSLDIVLNPADELVREVSLSR